MANWNRVTLAGNLTADPELRVSQNGTQICNFTLAFNEYRALDERRSHFFQCVAFGKIAERLVARCAKGANVLIGGVLQQDRWEDKETGQQRSAVKVIVHELQMLGPARQQGANHSAESDTVDAVGTEFVTEDMAPF